MYVEMFENADETFIQQTNSKFELLDADIFDRGRVLTPDSSYSDNSKASGSSNFHYQIGARTKPKTDDILILSRKRRRVPSDREPVVKTAVKKPPSKLPIKPESKLPTKPKKVAAKDHNEDRCDYCNVSQYSNRYLNIKCLEKRLSSLLRFL